MIKKIIVTACFFLSLLSNAQSGSASPYSFYGIGEAKFKGNLENRSMGGVNIEQDSLNINILNPASFAKVRFTTFAIAANYTNVSLKTDTEKQNAHRTSLDYIAVSLPLGKFGVGMGLLPYTSVGYNIESISSDPNGTNNVLKGTGGLSKAFLSLGYTVIPNLLIGADLQFNFGRINNSNLEYISGVFVGTQVENKADLNGIAANFGIMYQNKIYNKYNLYSSLTYAPQAVLSSTNTRTVSSVNYNSNYDVQVVDTYETKEIRTDLTIPQKISFGFGVGESKKWMLGTQMTFQDTEKLTDEFDANSNVTYSNSSSYSLGGYYLPNHNLFSKYYQKVVYRAGIKYTISGTTIENEDINEKGITLGFGFPVPASTSKVNLGLEYGKKGTTSNGLIQEDYFVIGLSFSFNEKWFRQNRID
jgi:hypothetical protein